MAQPISSCRDARGNNDAEDEAEAEEATYGASYGRSMFGS